MIGILSWSRGNVPDSVSQGHFKVVTNFLDDPSLQMAVGQLSSFTLLSGQSWIIVQLDLQCLRLSFVKVEDSVLLHRVLPMTCANYSEKDKRSGWILQESPSTFRM